MAPAPNRVSHPVEVVGVTDIAPHMRRIRIAGDALDAMPVDLPGQWLKVFFPRLDERKAHGRAYTIRHHHRGSAAMDLDFVLHGDEGEASRWAGQARVGDTLSVAGPREGYQFDPAAEGQLLVGDSTALPAIAAILESLPDALPAQVFLEVTDEEERDLLPARPGADVHVFAAGAKAAGSTGRLERVLREVALPATPRVWIAGEAIMVRNMRNALWDRGVPREAVTASGYWRVGIADHRDASLA